MDTWNQATADRVAVYCAAHAAELVPNYRSGDWELPDASLRSIAEALGLPLNDLATTYYDDVCLGVEAALASRYGA